MGVLYDSVGPCPKPAAMYVDGHEGVVPLSEFQPGDLHISVLAGDWEMLDCEPGNASPEACADRAVDRAARGLWTAIYVGDVENGYDYTNWYQRVTARLAARGSGWSKPERWATVPGGAPGVYWIAIEAGGIPYAHRNPNSIATQWMEEALVDWMRCDISETLSPFPYPPTAETVANNGATTTTTSTAETPPPPPKPKETEMFVAEGPIPTPPGAQLEQWLITNAGTRIHVATGPDGSAFLSALNQTGPLPQLSAGQLSAIPVAS